MKSYQKDISLVEARKETQLYIEEGVTRLRTRLKAKKLAHV